MNKGWLSVVLWILVLPTAAMAHLLPRQTATMTVSGQSAYFVVAVPVSALAGVDDDGDGELSRREILVHNRLIQRQFDDRFRVQDRDAAVTGRRTWAVPANRDRPDERLDYVVVMHRVDFAQEPLSPVLETDLFGSGPGESRMTITATRGSQTEVAILEPGAGSHRFFRGALATFSDFVRTGIEHIWTGSDHLLFLLTILVAGAGWRHWLGVVTAFTVAHSITLVLSTLGLFRIPAGLVEPGIAASIVLMGGLNLWLGRSGQAKAGWGRVPVVFACGLLHGFGFASAIGAMAVDPGSRLATLAGFNVGIEIGQFLFLAAITLAVAGIARLTPLRLQERLPVVASCLAVGLGTILLIQRLLPA
jgi:hydrogenase/urease accessory protein HupE